MLTRFTLSICFSLLSLCLLLAQNFSEKMILVPNTGFTKQSDVIVPANFGGDKDYFVQFTDGVLSVFKFEGDDQIVMIDEINNLPALHMVDFLDFDEDGDVDILTNRGIITNQGNEDFSDLSLPGSFTLNGSIQRYVDFDKDGNLDLIATSNTFSTATLTIYYTNDMHLVFDSEEIGDSDSYEVIRITDFDGDDDNDIIYAADIFGDDHIGLLRNEGNGQFTSSKVGAFSVSRTSMILGDLDNDLDSDVLIPGGSSDLDWVENNEGALSDFEELDGNVTALVFETADFNNDDNLDIVILDDTDFENYKLMVLLGNGDGTLQEGVEIGQVTGLSPLSVSVNASFENWLTVKDINDDGLVDILVNELADQQYSVFLNNPISSTENYIDPSFHLSPNPATDVLQLSWAGAEERAIAIYDIQGVLRWKQDQYAAGNPLNISQLQKGMYLLKIISENNRIMVSRFLKM